MQVARRRSRSRKANVVTVDVMRILLAEDDRGLRFVLVKALREQGYVVDAAGTGDEALHLIGEHDYAMAIVDWRMPGKSGVDIIAMVRQQQKPLPIMMLTARDAPEDRVIGLDTGADDYVVKPFDLSELLARVRALLRRPREGGSPLLRCGGLIFDPNTQELSVDSNPLAVTATERRILELLLRNSPRLVTRRAIAEHGWVDDLEPLGSNAIDVHMARLRSKLAGARVRIVTVRGSGFRLEPE